MNRDDVLASIDPYYVPPKPKSLTEMKIERVQRRLQEKNAKRDDPTDSLGALRRLKYGNETQDLNKTNYIDVFQSSAIEEIGTIADGTRDTFNRLTDSDWQLGAELDSWSDKDVADRIAGVSKEYRQAQEQKSLTDIRDEIKAGNYGKALLGGLDQGAYFLADSGGSILSAGIGGLYTKGVKTLFGGTKLFNKVDKTLDKAGVVGKTTKRVANAVSQSSLMTLTDVQRIREEYIKEHNEDMSNPKLLATVIGASAFSTLDFKIATKLIKPKIRKEAKEIVKDVLTINKESFRRDIVGKLYDGTKRIAIAGGAEAAQEYFQTWHEILASKVTDKSYVPIMKQIANEVGLEENRIDAIFGSIAGFGAGTTAKTVITAPSTALGVSLDATKGVVKETTKRAGDWANKKSFALLGEESRQNLRDKHEQEKAVYEETRGELKTRIEELVKAKTIDDLKGTKIREDIATIQDENNVLDEELSDPKKFKKFKDTVLAKYKKDITTAYLNVYKGSTARLLKNVGKDTDKSLKEALEKVNLDDAYEAAKTLGKDSVEALKNINSTAAAGIVNEAVRYTGNEKSKTGKKIKLLANSLTSNDTKEVIKLIKKEHPKTAELLKSTLEAKERAEVKLGLKEPELVDKAGLSKVIRDADKNVNTAFNSALIRDISNELNKDVANKETLETIKNALKNFKESDTYKNSSKEYKRNIERLVKRADKKKSFKTVTEKIVDATSKAVDKGIDKTKEVFEEVTKEGGTLDKAVDSVDTLVFNAKIKADKDKDPELNEYIKKVRENQDLEEIKDLVRNYIREKKIDSTAKVEKFLKKNKLLESKESIGKVVKDLEKVVNEYKKSYRDYEKKVKDIEFEPEDIVKEINTNLGKYDSEKTNEDFNTAVKLLGSKKFLKSLKEDFKVTTEEDFIIFQDKYLPNLKLFEEIIEVLENKLFGNTVEETDINDIKRRDTDVSLTKEEARKVMKELNIKECK